MMINNYISVLKSRLPSKFIANKEDIENLIARYNFCLIVIIRNMKIIEETFWIPPPPPQKICEYLNGYIIGHDVMKKALSVAMFNHYSSVIG